MSADYEKLINIIRKRFADKGFIDGEDKEFVDAEIEQFALRAAPFELRNFFVRCGEFGDIIEEIAYASMHRLAENGHLEIIDALFDATKPESYLYPIYQIGKAFADCLRYDAGNCARNMREAIFHCAVNNLKFADGGFIIQNVFLMESEAWPPEERFPNPSFDIVFERPFAHSPYTCFVTADRVYARHYAERFMRELRERSPGANVFVMLVNPDEAVKNYIGELADSFGGIIAAETHYGGRWIGEFCISSRFMMAADVARYVNQPLIMQDIDGEFPEGSGDVLEKIARFPLSYCTTGSPFPTLHVSAAVLGIGSLDEALPFLDQASDFMREDFAREGPLWMLDQSALYRAVCVGRQKGWNMTELNSALGGPVKLPDFFTIKDETKTIPLSERKAIRMYNYYKFSGFTPEKRLVFRAC